MSETSDQPQATAQDDRPASPLVDTPPPETGCVGRFGVLFIFGLVIILISAGVNLALMRMVGGGTGGGGGPIFSVSPGLDELRQQNAELSTRVAELEANQDSVNASLVQFIQSLRDIANASSTELNTYLPTAAPVEPMQAPPVPEPTMVPTVPMPEVQPTAEAVPPAEVAPEVVPEVESEVSPTAAVPVPPVAPNEQAAPHGGEAPSAVPPMTAPMPEMATPGAPHSETTP